MPFNTIDPVVMAARTVMSLQTIVSRENNPMDPVVLTIGSIHGGTQANVIPDQVTLGLNIRTYSDETQKRVVAAVMRIAKAEGVTHRYVRHLIPLAFLAPDIVAAILSGTQPVDLTAETLTRRTDLPTDWTEQKALMGCD